MPTIETSLRASQEQADALVRLHPKGQVFTLEEFGEALGAGRQSKAFLTDAARRGLVEFINGTTVWKRV